MDAAPIRIWLEREARLLRLRLARPKANVLDAAMVEALDGAFVAHGGNPDLHAVLLDAEGPNFSFGASVEEHLPQSCAAMLANFHALALRVLRSGVPVLVAIRGQCLGGGLELACAGHLLFAAPDARLGQPEIQLGVFAPAASCLLPERIGLAQAEDLLLSGRSIGADEAHRMGLVNAVAEDPEATALAYFDQHLAPRSAHSLRHAVRAARHDMADRVASKLGALERSYLDELMRSHDAVEGLRAFLGKRPAQWRNR
jgi:cyclohexa-1,5-dienecarbonyl-CoA hydratase